MAQYPQAMVRWDMSGRALVVCDAPRRGGYANSASGVIERDLLWVDLPDGDYGALLAATFHQPDIWREGWFSEQALLAGILMRNTATASGLPDKPLLRIAMLACAQGEKPVRAFLAKLRGWDAEALRLGSTRSIQACAALAAHWLWTAKEIGLPEMRGIAR